MYHESAQLSVVNRQHTSAASHTIDVNIACHVRELLECMCQLATNIRVRLDELALAQKDRKSKSNLMKLAEDLQQCLDVRGSKLCMLISVRIENIGSNDRHIPGSETCSYRKSVVSPPRC